MSLHASPPPGPALTPIDTALATLLASLPEPTPTEAVPLGNACGRVLRQAIVAEMSVPPHANSAMDGYAVRAADTRDPMRKLPVSQRLAAGQVACVALGMKHIQEASVGDTFSDPAAPQPALPGFQKPQPMVFAGMYPLEGEGFDALQHAMSRFLLKDGSVTVEPESSPTLGQGLRCGFLGLLHLEVTS